MGFLKALSVLFVLFSLLFVSSGFRIYLDEEDGGDMEEVVKDGLVLWEDDGSSYLADKWTSLTRFWLEVDSSDDGQVESFEKPELIVSGDEKPKVLKVHLDGEASEGSLEDFEDYTLSDDDEDYLQIMPLYVTYECLTSGSKLITLKIKVKSGTENSEPKTYSISWNKVCGSGRRKGFTVIEEFDQELVVKDGVAEYGWTGDEDLFEVGSLDLSTSFFLHLERSYGSQVFRRPKIATQPEGNLEVTLHGQLGGAEDETLSDLTVVEEIPDDDGGYDSSTNLIVQYNCLKKAGPVKVTLSIPVPPFDDIKFSWIKNCGGGIHKGISIGTSPDRSDVVVKGVTTDKWKSGTKDGYLAKKDEFKTEFYVHSDGSFNLRKIPLTASSNIIRPRASVQNIDDGEDLITVVYTCVQMGEAQVTMTLPLLNHETVFVSWTKVCPVYQRPRYIDSEESYWTANQLLVLFCFTIVVISSIVYFLYSKMKNNRKAYRNLGQAANDFS